MSTPQLSTLRSDTGADHGRRCAIADGITGELQLSGGGRIRLLHFISVCAKWLNILQAAPRPQTILLGDLSAYLSHYSNKTATIYVPTDGQVARTGHYCPEILRFAPHVHTIVHNDRVCRRFSVLAHNGKVCV